jgi:CHASE2 domain-containing sensor protein/class 3 adenylate cyclase
MGDTPAKSSRTAGALLIGLAATVLVLVAHLAGVDRRTELLALDFRFRHLSSAPEGKGIVIVEIDDRSLELEERWVWSRERIARIAGILTECGAKAVALDIIMQEPQPTRYVSPATDVYDPDAGALIGSGQAQPVFDDAIFEQALADQTLLLPMSIKFVAEKIRDDPNVAKSVRDAFDADPNVPFAQILRKTFPDTPAGRKPEKLDQAKRIYWRLRALRYLRDFALPPERFRSAVAPSGYLSPPFVRFAPYCSRSGFVSFPSELDGVMRRIPMLARSDGDVYPQFALALAVESLTGRRDKAELAAEGRTLRFKLPDGTVRAVPLDASGNLLINWADEVGGFESIPAHSVGFVWRRRQTQENNRRAARLATHQVMTKLKQRDLDKLFLRADALWKERIEYQTDRMRKALFDPGNIPPRPEEIRQAEAAVENQIAELTADLFEDLDFTLGTLPPEAPLRREVTALAARRAVFLAANQEIQEDIDANLALIREKVGGKICLVGSTATGAADFVTTPVAGRMPGVKVHANIFNTIASGAFMAEASPAANIAAILLAGAIVSLVGAKLSALRAGPAVGMLAVAFAAGNCFVVFRAAGYWLVLVAPLAAMVASFLAVTAYRQVTEEREKRHIRGLFAHAMSPALVDRLLEDPALLRLGGERRVLTSFFSDLAGFTTISERLGEQDTVRVLNRYFDRMEEVIQARSGGYLNKFLGDGLVVFFGAPVFQDDHARRAIEATVACQDEVALLAETLRGELGDWVELSCRVGVATGPVMVGNCGSTRRMDYTAIGNCVNLSSRLESANKQFHTKILIDDETWCKGGGDAFLARPFGGIVVVGQTEIIRVWNVAGRTEDAADETRSAFADFARAVECYEAARFEDALKLLEAVAGRLDGDGPTEMFLDLCRRHLADPPGDGFDPTIRLTQK